MSIVQKIRNGAAVGLAALVITSAACSAGPSREEQQPTELSDEVKAALYAPFSEPVFFPWAENASQRYTVVFENETKARVTVRPSDLTAFIYLDKDSGYALTGSCAGDLLRMEYFREVKGSGPPQQVLSALNPTESLAGALKETFAELVEEAFIQEDCYVPRSGQIMMLAGEPRIERLGDGTVIAYFPLESDGLVNKLVVSPVSGPRLSVELNSHMGGEQSARFEARGSCDGRLSDFYFIFPPQNGWLPLRNPALRSEIETEAIEMISKAGLQPDCYLVSDSLS
ncbi:hypothetical protein HYU18_03610 [Candidatus Woesearchaeota archaeon]|nr:hypothetical protein [Candidatus Woesearchaeota archaeon]